MTTEMQLVIGAADGDPDSIAALLAHHEPLILHMGSTYFLPGGDREDILQEARLGLIVAAEQYRSDRGASFQTYANMVVERRVITAVRTATRGKHAPLSQAVSLNAPVQESDDDSGLTVGDTLPSPDAEDPAERAIAREGLAEIVERSVRLTPLEREVIAGRLNGDSYDEIGSRKRVDNALQRAKHKLSHGYDRATADALRATA